MPKSAASPDHQSRGLHAKYLARGGSIPSTRGRRQSHTCRRRRMDEVWDTHLFYQLRENVGIGKRWNDSPGPKSTPKAIRNTAFLGAFSSLSSLSLCRSQGVPVV
eukprot:4850602-Amphidinium_carterae.1